MNNATIDRSARTKLSGALKAASAGVLALSVAGCGIFGGGDAKTTPTVGNRTPILSRIESGAAVDPALAGVTVVLPPAAGQHRMDRKAAALRTRLTVIWRWPMRPRAHGRRTLPAAATAGGWPQRRSSAAGGCMQSGPKARSPPSMRPPARERGAMRWTWKAACAPRHSAAASAMYDGRRLCHQRRWRSGGAGRGDRQRNLESETRRPACADRPRSLSTRRM